MPTKNRTQKQQLEINQPKSLPKEFFLKEYDSLFHEIREINKNTIEYTKLFITFATSVFIYAFGGFLYYDKLNAPDGGKFFFAYSLFGTLLTTIIFTLTAFVFIQLSNSKKIKIRYWRSLHILRGYIKRNFPDIGACLPFPPDSNSHRFRQKERPNITVAEIYGYIIMGFMLELVWLVVLVYFMTNMFQSWDHVDKGRLIKAVGLANWFLITILIFAPHQILTHRKMFKETRMITADNIYPEYPFGVHSRFAHNTLLSIGVVLYLLTFIKIFSEPYSVFSTWFPFIYALVLVGGSDLFFLLTSLFYYLQKRFSSNAIQEIRETIQKDPDAKWIRLTKLSLKY